jgi:hypothetical protein
MKKYKITHGIQLKICTNIFGIGKRLEVVEFANAIQTNTHMLTMFSKEKKLKLKCTKH